MKPLLRRKLRDRLATQRTVNTVLLPGTVTSVTPGGAADGVAALVTVNVRGDVFACQYLGAAPANGATVTVAICDSIPTILGVPRGAPPTT